MIELVWIITKLNSPNKEWFYECTITKQKNVGHKWYRAYWEVDPMESP
jgi:hypothetical protein